MSRTTVPLYQIKTFSQLRSAFIEPTFLEFLYFLFIGNRPTFHEARMWAMRFDDGPMTKSEFSDYVNLYGFTTPQVESMNRSRCLTTFGWFLDRLYMYLKTIFTYRFKQYRDQEFDNISNAWSDIRERQANGEFDMDDQDEDDKFYDDILAQRAASGIRYSS